MTDQKTIQAEPVDGSKMFHSPGSSTLVLGLLGSGLMWLPQPPVGWWPLAWIAPIPWLLLIRKCALTGRWAYGWVGLASWLFWLLTIHWIRLPHPVNYLAWPALAAVMAAYLPLFIVLARVGVHQLRWPLWLVAPVAWIGVEWLRAHLLSGFYMASLAQTQVPWLPIIQVADLFGEYGVTFLIVLVAACLTQVWPFREPADGSLDGGHKPRLLVLVPGGVAMTLALGYGHLRLERLKMATLSASDRAGGPRLALIQGYAPADWKSDRGRQRQIMDQYERLSREAVSQAGGAGEVEPSVTVGPTAQRRSLRPIDLVVWPETMFRQPLLSVAPGFKPAQGWIDKLSLIHI